MMEIALKVKNAADVSANCAPARVLRLAAGRMRVKTGAMLSARVMA